MQRNDDRRDFLKKGLVLAGTAGLLGTALAPVAARAQTLGAMRRANRHDDSYIFERKPFTWPGNKTLAVWIAPNVEVWHFDSPVGQQVTPNTANRVPDVRFLMDHLLNGPRWDSEAHLDPTRVR